MVTAEMETQAIARCVLESLSDEKIELSVPNTSYRLHLKPAVRSSEITTPIGKRIKGTIHAQALRIFWAQGGGRFMEPIWGEPRIVAGMVLAIDEAGHRILVHTGVPMWMTLVERQPADMFKPGQMVNCYIESGATFTPA